MTRKEITGVRNLEFSQWIRDNLPDSNTPFIVSDLDFILYNKKTQRMMLIEVKTHRKELTNWQNELFIIINNLIKKGVSTLKDDDFKYEGFHTIMFFDTSFKDDGKCKFDGKFISENDLIKKLSMEE